MLPLFVIGAAAILLGFVVKKTPAATGTTSASTAKSGTAVNAGSLSAPILQNGKTIGAAVPPLTYIPPIYTNRATGPLLGAKQTEGLMTGVTGEQQDIGFAKSIVGYVQTAAQLAVQLSQVVASTIGSYVPIVGAAIGVGFGAASASAAQNDTQKDKANQQIAAGVVSLLPGVGLVTLAGTFESIAASKIARQRIIDAKHEQAKSYADLGVWIPKGISVSDRLDEWYLLPRLSESNQIGWATQANADAQAVIDALPGTISVAMDHLRYGEQGRGASEGITLVPPRDVTQLEKTLDLSIQDALILYMVSADLLNRKGRPYKIAQYAQGNYLLANAAGYAGWPGGWDNPVRFGVVPGAFVADGTISVPLAPSLQVLFTQLRPPRMLETFQRYWESADLLRFHASTLYARMVQSRALMILDDLAPIPPVVNPSSAQVQIELAQVQARTAAQIQAASVAFQESNAATIQAMWSNTA